MLKDEKMMYQIYINQAWKNGISEEKHYYRQRYSLQIRRRTISQKNTTV